MKTKINLIFMFVILACSVYGQSVKKEFYDYKKTKIMSEYQVNAAGEKNGWFKGYNESGVVIEEATFKNGQLNGVFKKYSTYSGKREITQSETYKDGVLNGLAQYFGTLDGKAFVMKEGNFLDGERNGKWLIIKPTPNYNIKEEEKKGCEYVKEEIEYQKGNEVSPPDGKRTIYYFPSGKVRCEEEYTNGVKTGQHKWYYPNGKPEADYLFDGQTGKYLKKKSFYTNGQLWESYDWSSGKEVFLDYNEDGSPGMFTKRRMAQENEQKNKTIKLALADSLLLANNATEAIKIYQEIKYSVSELNAILKLETSFNKGLVEEDQSMNFNNSAKSTAKDISEKSTIKYLKNNNFGKSDLESTSEKTEIQKKFFEEKKVQIINKATEVVNAVETVNKKLELYTASFVQMNSGSPSYLKGEHIYLKSKMIIDELLEGYNKSVTPDEKLNSSKSLIVALDKMIAHANSDQCKDLNKQLKKVEDKSQIKTLLGL